MKTLFHWMGACLRAWVTSRSFDLAMENLALRQQVAALQRSRPRAKPRRRDRVFWVLISRIWPHWKSACLIVSPAAVVAWHRAGFRAYWRWKSRRRAGRPSTRADVVAAIRRLASENPRWGAPRIHGELRMLGFRVSQATVSRLLRKRPASEAHRQSWRTFLHNHREHLAGMDFFTVPTATFRQLYGLVILRHGRREVAHVNVTAHPTAAWVAQQLREAFPENTAPKYLVFDRDTIFGATKDLVHRLGIEPKVIGFRCPWQNGAVERFIGTLRRELLDHVIVWDEAHLHRLLNEFVRYYHDDRTHLGLGKETPLHRPRDASPAEGSDLHSEPRLGGLHHRYRWRRAA
jgi:transposase InsO family protein